MPATYLQVHVHIKARIKRAKQLRTTSTTMYREGASAQVRERWEDTNYGESVSVDGQYLGG